ncbi:putative reverse transcriptase domain-containing protein [Tanacetum coccineum]
MAVTTITEMVEMKMEEITKMEIQMRMVEMLCQLLVFHISNCPEVYQVKYATCTLLDGALTWWNSHKRTIGVDATMVLGEEDRIGRYVRGLPGNIQGNVMSAEPMRLQDAIKLANSLMDQKLKGYAIRSAENKRKAYTAGGNEGQVYVGPHPLCNKCKLHHVGPCIIKCRSCGKISHLTRDCKPAILVAVNQRAPVPVIPEARGKAYTIGGGDANPGSNVVTGADRSFVSTTFSTLLDVIPNTLDVSYAVELADGRIAETNTVLKGCTIGLLGHPFNIDLMPVELGSFDVIIGMNWLANNHAVIICDEKTVHIPFGDEILIV